MRDCQGGYKIPQIWLLMAFERTAPPSSIYQLFFQKNSDFLCCCTRTGQVLQVNDRWRAFFPADSGNLTSSLAAFFHPLDQDAVGKQVFELSGERVRRFPARLQNSLGESLLLDWEILQDDECLILTGRDSTERDREAEQLNLYRFFLHEAQVQARMGHYQFHITRGTWESSATLDELFGIDDQYQRDVSGWLALVHPDQREEMVTYLQENILVRREDFDKVYRIIRPLDQSERWVHGKGKLLFDAHGAPRELYGSIRDIHREKTGAEALNLAEKNLQRVHRELERRQRELQDSEELFRNAFRTSPDSININSLDGHYVDVNEGFCRTTGYSREECIGQSSLKLNIWSNPADRDRMMVQLKETGECRNLEAFFLRKDGQKILGLMSAKIIYLKGVPHILSITRDISELRRTQDELARVQKLESLGLLAGGIAHDFNNLFAGIFGFIELSLLTLDPAHKAHQYLEKAKKAQIRSVELTRQLLIFAKGGSPVRKLLNLRPLMEECTRQPEGSAVFQVELDLAPLLWPIVADEGQISQVLGNLINNARQASAPQGTIRLSAQNVKIHETVDGKVYKGSFVRIEVQDFGEGISDEALPKVFDPFFTTRNRGSGLGLSVCYSIVQKHEGFIRIRSQVGEGTLVEICLPAVKNNAEECEQPQNNVLTGGRILLLDDEESVREVVGEYLRQLGFDVDAVATGEAALNLWKKALTQEAPFRAGVFDLTLKTGMGGLETSRAVLEIDPEARIIVASGYSFDEALAQPEKFRLAGSLRKPFGPEELQAILGRILN